MLIAIMRENMRCYRVDRARYHEAMDEYWAEKRREKLENFLFPRRRRSAAWSMTARKKPPQRQL